MRVVRLASALFLLLPAALFAGGFSRGHDFHLPTEAEKSLKSEDGSPAAVLDWVRMDDDTDGIEAEYVRIKIFTDEGKKYGDVEVPYFNAYPILGLVTDISARTIHADGTIVPFDGKVYDKVLYKSGGVSGGVSLRARTFSLADVQAGSILEYRFLRRHAGNILTDTFWELQRDIPLLHAKLTLRPYPKGDFLTFFTYAGLPAGKVPVRSPDRSHYDLEVDHIPPFSREEYAPPEEELKPHVAFYYTSSHLRPDEFWKAQAQQYLKTIETFIGSPAQFAAAWAAATPNDTTSADEKARKIYARTQRLRNLSFGTETSQTTASRSALAVLDAGAGFSDEISRSFVALARADGLDAVAVRVAPRNRSFFSDKIPDANQMNGEIALVMIDGKPVYLDPGTPGTPYGVVSWEKTGVPAIRMSRNGPEWIKTPAGAPAEAVVQRKADLRVEDEGLKGTVTATFTGQEALIRRLRGDDEAARKKALEEEVKGWFPNGAILKLVKVDDLSSSADAVVAKFDVELPNVISSAGTRTLVPLSVFTTTSKNPFAKSTRTQLIYFQYARSTRDEVTITVPPSMEIVSLPQAAELSVGVLKYSSNIRQNGNDVVFHRTMNIDAMFVERQYYGALRNFFAAVGNAEQRPLVIKRAGN
jgi:hypothetical protein